MAFEELNRFQSEAGLHFSKNLIDLGRQNMVFPPQNILKQFLFFLLFFRKKSNFKQK